MSLSLYDKFLFGSLKGGESLKKIILVILMLFSLIGIVAAIDEYRVGYDEIPATVNYIWRARGKYTSGERYTFTWYDREGNLCRESLANNDGYKEGDEIIVKVDKDTHENLYEPTAKMVVFSLMFVIALLTFLSIRKEHNRAAGKE